MFVVKNQNIILCTRIFFQKCSLTYRNIWLFSNLLIMFGVYFWQWLEMLYSFLLKKVQPRRFFLNHKSRPHYSGKKTYWVVLPKNMEGRWSTLEEEATEYIDSLKNCATYINFGCAETMFYLNYYSILLTVFSKDVIQSSFCKILQHENFESFKSSTAEQPICPPWHPEGYTMTSNCFHPQW